LDDNCDGITDEGCATYYWDADNDGYGNPGGPTTTVPQADYVANSGDCDDTNGAVNPGATEICNGVDDNCDSGIDEGCATYYRDADGDTYGDPGVSATDTSQPAGYVSDSSDCNDADAGINPGATEICNGTDDDCDGNTDEGCATYYEDLDSDGYGNAAVSQVATSQPTGYVTNSSDCNDTNGAINPGATETCNGVDDNCDGSADEGCVTYYQDSDSDGYGNAAVSQVATSQPAGYVANSSDCNDGDNSVYPGASELCDGKDNDCDALSDEGCQLLYRDADSDGYGNPAGPTTTVPQPGYTANFGDCDDTNSAVNPGAAEVCNGVDDNGDGNTDEGFDADAGGVADCIDNCPADPNPDQADQDGDGVGDVCDTLVPPTPEEQIDNIIGFFEDAVGGGTLAGSSDIPVIGYFQLILMERLLDRARDRIDQGRTALACFNLSRALLRSDGLVRPLRDYVTGPAAEELANQIQDLRTSLGCN